NAEYGTILPFAKGANGIRPAMPERARSFLKGVLDLLAGTKTGELTPEAVDTFTAITGGAGRLVGPRGGAETLAAGGKRSVEQIANVPQGGGYRELMSDRVFKKIAKKHAPWRLEEGR